MTGDDVERLHRMLDDGLADEVVAEARRGLATTAHHEQYRTLLIAALIELGEADDALEQARFGVSELPESVGLHRLLARSLLATRRWPEAVDASDAAVRLAPGDATSLLAAAETRAAFAASLADRSKEQRTVLAAAEQAARAASAAAPDQVGPHFLVGRIALIGRDWVGARAAAERGLAIDPEHADGHGILSEALLGSGDVAAAGTHAMRAVQHEPTRLDFAEVLDAAGPPIWQWSVAGMMLLVPIASLLDGSFEPWMAISGLLGGAGLAWLKFAPSNRVDADTAAFRRDSRER